MWVSTFSRSCHHQRVALFSGDIFPALDSISQLVLQLLHRVLVASSLGSKNAVLSSFVGLSGSTGCIGLHDPVRVVRKFEEWTP